MLVSPSSAVAEMCEGVSSDSDWEYVEPQSFSFSRKRSIVRVENQEDMSYEGTPVKAPPTSGRRMMPPTHTAELVLFNRGCAVANRGGGSGKRLECS